MPCCEITIQLNEMRQKKGILLLLASALIAMYLLSPADSPVYFNKLIYGPVYHLNLISSNKAKLQIGFTPLPQTVVDQVKYFVYFLGRSRSGHSIVGSILDSHPHMVVSHETGIFLQLKAHPEHYTSKSVVFNELWENSFNACHHNGLRSSNSQDISIKGYSLGIDGLYQGAYLSHIDVIGDKNGGRTVSVFNQDPLEWERVFFKLKSLVNIPFKVIYVIRNPYDNIATARLYHSLNMSEVRNLNETVLVDDFSQKAFVKQIDRHFNSHQAICDMQKKYNLDLLEIHVKDLIEDPKATILHMCQFLGVQCSNSYVEVCSSKLFKTESKTRYKMRWTPGLISRVKMYISRYKNLQRYYSFDS